MSVIWDFEFGGEGLNEVSTLYRDRDPGFLQTLQLVREITKQMEDNPLRHAA